MKKRQNLTTRQGLTDFAGKLTAKWNSLMTQTSPSEPQDKQSKTAAENMRDIFCQLVSLPTVTGNWDANRDALDYVENFLKKRGMHSKRYEWNGVQSLVATTRQTKKPAIFLTAHIDVVPGSEELFELRETDGKFFGRGVLDMKFAIAAYMQLIDDLGKELSNYDIGIMINTDEEVGGMDGANRVVEEGYLPKVVVAPDGGQDWAIEQFAKGIYWLTITATGKSAHGSRPWEGSSAIDTLLDVLAGIRKLFPNQNAENSTLNIGTVNGGTTPNQLADRASASLDIRLASEADDQRLYQAIMNICDKAGVQLTVDVYAPPFINDPENPYIKGFAESIEKVIGRHPGLTTSNALNDARFFGPKGVPCVILYPPGGDHHGAKEWIAAEGFYQFREVLRDYVEKFGKR
jgi:succinyl-diaminopimelate desuccinylase